uniref:Cell cycle control protein n=1 Tax=Canis lupus dingo TaxID=286419 RepID=A0A8C0K8W6_CANLU
HILNCGSSTRGNFGPRGPFAMSRDILPDNTALKQQQLPAYRLQLSATGVLSGFFAAGAFFHPIYFSILFTNPFLSGFFPPFPCPPCLFPSGYRLTHCKGNVYMYYKLYGFYQNLYQYILSRSNSQLLGTDLKVKLYLISYNTLKKKNSTIFNFLADTIILSYNLNSSIPIEVPMLKSKITWWTDKYVKFQNPSSINLSSAFAGTTKPPYWSKPVYELDEEDPGNNGFLNDDFIVWMRTAAFPTFKKLYRRLNRIQYFIEGLPAGNYSFNITYITRFKGEKSVVLSTLTWSGGSSLFLGLAYTVTGAVTCIGYAVLTREATIRHSTNSTASLTLFSRLCLLFP